MATYYWVGGSGGNWSDSSKWSLTSGGAGGAGVPTTADTAIVNAASLSADSTITVNTTVTVTTFTISSVDVMVTLASAGNLTVTGTCAISVLSGIQSYGLTITGNATFGALTLSSGTLSLGSSNITVNGVVSVTGISNRTLAFGTGSINIVRTITGNLTIWSGATATNLTVTGSRNVNFTLVGTALTYDVSITHGTTSGTGANSINIASLSSTVPGSSAVLISGHYNTFNLGSFQKTLANSVRTIYGSITFNSSTILTSGASVTTISNNGVNKTITSNGVSIPFPITINSAGLEKITLNDAMTISSGRTLTLTSGYIDLNGFTLTCPIFSSSGSTARGIDFSYNPVTDTSGNMVLNAGTITGNVTIWSCANITNMALTNSKLSVVVNAATAVTATINHGGTAGNSSSNRLRITGFTTSSSSVIVTTTGHFSEVTLNDPAGALRYTATAMTIYSALIVGASTIVNGSISTVTMSVGTLLTSNGVLLDFNVAIAASTGSPVGILDAVTIGPARTLTLTSGTFDLNGFTLTIGRFASSSSTIRAIAFNSGNLVINAVITAISSIWAVDNVSNFSYTGTWSVTFNSSGAFTNTINHGGTLGGSEATAIPNLTNPTLGGSLALVGHFIDVDFTGISNSITISGMTVYRDLKVSNTLTMATAGSSIIFSGTTYNKSITSNGNTFNNPIDMNAVGKTLTLNDALSMSNTSAFNLVNGTINLNSFTFTCGRFSSNNSNTRSINFNSGNITVNAAITAATTVWNMQTATNYSYTGSHTVTIVSSGAFTTQIYHASTAGGSESNAMRSLVVTSAGAQLDIQGHFVDVDLSAISNAIITNNRTIYGAFKLSATSTFSVTGGTTTFSGTTYTKTLETSNNPDVRMFFNIDCAGSTVTLIGNLTYSGVGSAGGINFTNGAFDANGYDVSVNSVYLGAGTKTLYMGSGTWSVVIWDMSTNAAGLTFFKQTANIVLNKSSSLSYNFYGGGLTYNRLTLSPPGNSSTFNIYNSNIFDELASSGAFTFSLRFEVGSTNTFNTWTATGSSGAVMTLTSIAAGTHTLSKSSGTVSVSYAAISNSIATGGASWQSYTSNGNTDGGGNSGWNFGAIVAAAIGAFFAFF